MIGGGGSGVDGAEDEIGPRVSLREWETWVDKNMGNQDPVFFCFTSQIKKFLDVDGDGYIDKNDLEIFIKRFQKMDQAKSNISQSVYSYRTSLKKYALYPKAPLESAKTR